MRVIVNSWKIDSLSHACITNIFFSYTIIQRLSGDRRGFHRPGHNVPQHGGPREPPGGGAALRRRLLRVLPLRLRGLPGHPLRPLQPPILQGVLHLRHRRLHLRQRRGGPPELHDLRAAADGQAEEPRHRAGPHRPEPEHGHLHPQLACHGRAGPRSGPGLVQDLPGAAMEGVLADGLHADVPGQPGGPHRVARVGRGLCPRHAVLRRVQEHRPGLSHHREGQLARLPRLAQRFGGVAFYGRKLYCRTVVASGHRRAVHCRTVISI